MKIQLATFSAAGARGGWRGHGGAGVELGGEPAQAAAVAAVAQFGVQPSGAADSLLPALAPVNLVRPSSPGRVSRVSLISSPAVAAVA